MLISFNDASMFIKHHNKDVQIRGFLQKTSDNFFILSPEPDLKSCCIGKKGKIHIHVTGLQNAPATKKALTIQGRFILANGTDFHIEDATIVDEDRDLNFSFIIVSISMTILGLYLLLPYVYKEKR